MEGRARKSLYKTTLMDHEVLPSVDNADLFKGMFKWVDGSNQEMGIKTIRLVAYVSI